MTDGEPAARCGLHQLYVVVAAALMTLALVCEGFGALEVDVVALAEFDLMAVVELELADAVPFFLGGALLWGGGIRGVGWLRRASSEGSLRLLSGEQQLQLSHHLAEWQGFYRLEMACLGHPDRAGPGALIPFLLRFVERCHPGILPFLGPSHRAAGLQRPFALSAEIPSETGSKNLPLNTKDPTLYA